MQVKDSGKPIARLLSDIKENFPQTHKVGRKMTRKRKGAIILVVISMAFLIGYIPVRFASYRGFSISARDDFRYSKLFIWWFYSPVRFIDQKLTGREYWLIDEQRLLDEEQKYLEWCNYLTRHITPRLCAYYQLHPNRFKPTGKGEEIEIDGFVEFIKDDDYFQSPLRCRIRDGRLRDPWGDPVHFVQDLNMDGFIEARGQRRAVIDMVVWEDIGERADFLNERRLGICKDNLKGLANPWESIFVLSYHYAKWKR